MNPRRASSTAADPISALAVLGLVDDGHDQSAIGQAVRLNHAAAIWSLATASQTLAFTVLVVAAAMLGMHPLIGSIIAVGAGVVALSLLTFACLTVPAVQAWQPHQRNRAITAFGGGLAAGLFALLWIAAQLPLGPLQLGSFVAVAGAIGITTVALHPVRTATLGFGFGLVVTLAILSGQPVPIGVATMFLAGLVIATLRLARLDVQHARSRASEASEGRLAAKMRDIGFFL